ncbi:hypothetical protein [Pseudonocardia sp. NPDC049154]|uniref:FadR/GntR family transcriptional regulator n=1 Tax=Pseudonocardia sp. NPDC049154 TaxID=3155501 RepID=UPI0033D9A3ED
MSWVQLRPAPPRRTFDEIIGQIRAMIQSGELAAVTGCRPSGPRRAVRVSRNTMREAVRMLEISGLVTIKKGAAGGAFVTSPDSAAIALRLADTMHLTEFSLADLSEARLWVESIAVRVACQRMTEEDRDRRTRTSRSPSASPTRGAVRSAPRLRWSSMACWSTPTATRS